MTELTHIGKFKVTGKLGQGSFGVVYKGRDPHIRRDVAIKVCTVRDEGLRKRFAREAQISGNLRHKNIVTVFAADTTAEGVPFLVQEFLDGEDLREVIRRRDLIPSDRKIDYLLQVARGLAHAHAHGVIHRDIKPGNVRLLADGTVKIMDFGIAKLASAETQLTQKGVTMGTASYLPPEQVRGGDLDHRADVFSFGVLAYELLTYERPFRGNTLSALVYQILYKVPAPMTAVWPDCPEVLSEVVAKCLEKKPEARFSSFQELIPRLEQIAADIQAGKWPALRGVSTVETFLSEIPEDTAVMSQTQIARTAREVERGDVPPPELATLPAADSTQPMLRLPEKETRTAGHSMETAPTQVLSTTSRPAPPPAAHLDAESASSAPTELLTQEQLAARASQIGSLIAEGKLEAAKERLEETITEQLEASGALAQAHLAPPPPAPAGTPSPVDTAAGAGAATVEVPLPPRPPVPSSRPPASSSRPPAPSSRPPAPSSRPPQDEAPEPDTGGTATYMTTFSALPAWLRWGAAAALVVAAAVAGWWLLRPAGAPASGVRPIETPVPVPPPPGEEPLAAAPTGTVTVNAVPWAEIKEIADGEGFVRDLPANPYTPARLELPPGHYLIQLANEDFGAGSCEVDVVAGAVTPCRVELEPPSATDYFKAIGWWR